MERRHGVFRFCLPAQMILRHKIDCTVRLHSQHIAQIIVLAIPNQQPLPGGILPPKCILILIQGIHPVVAVHVRKEELHPFGQHSVPIAHRNAVDVRHHGRPHCRTRLAQILLPAAQPLPVYRAIHQIVKVQVICRETNLSPRHQAEKCRLFFLRCRLPKLLHAEQGFTVPAEPPIFRLLHQ